VLLITGVLFLIFAEFFYRVTIYYPGPGGNYGPTDIHSYAVFAQDPGNGNYRVLVKIFTALWSINESTWEMALLCGLRLVKWCKFDKTICTI
jgi:hypothetical protein